MLMKLNPVLLYMGIAVKLGTSFNRTFHRYLNVLTRHKLSDAKDVLVSSFTNDKDRKKEKDRHQLKSNGSSTFCRALAVFSVR